MQLSFTPIILAICLAATFSCNKKMDEAAAIRQLLEKESATWRAGDFKSHSECWHIQPYSKILVSTSQGQVYDVPPTLMQDPNTKMGNGGSSENSNYQMSIHGDHAWVSHDEVSFDKNGVKTMSHEIRILEKVHGQWKLVAQSIHQYE